MTALTNNTAETSPFVKLHLKLLESRFRTAKGSLEMLTVFKHPNLKSVSCMIEDCELLLDAARELHQAMSKNDFEVVFEQMAPKANRHDCKSEVEFTFENFGQLAKHFLENPLKQNVVIQKITTKDWILLSFIKSEKSYKGLQVEIDGEKTTINTFADYCSHAVGITGRMANMYLKCINELDKELFTALLDFDIGIRNMLAVCKISAEQKHALLQIAQTGDKAATLAFIEQALQAGE